MGSLLELFQRGKDAPIILLSFRTDCLPSHVLFRGVCIQSCPETFFKEISRGSGETSDGRSGSLRGNDSNISFICLPCHYTCKTCSGPNSFECLTCHSDSSLHVQNSGAGNAVTEYHCYPAVILEKLNSNALSYQVLMVSFLACMIVVALLAIYVVCSRRESPLGQPRSVFQRQSYYRVSPDEDSLNSHSSVVQDVESEESDEEVSYVKPLTAKGKGAQGHSATRNGPDATYMARNANTFVAVPRPDFVIAKNDNRNAIFDEKLQSVL